MLRRIRHAADLLTFNTQCRGILATPPLQLVPAPLRIVSMVCRKHLIMYLVAIKTFYRHFGRGGVAVLNDGSLTAEDLATLRAHIPGVEIFHARDIPLGPAPRGNCWERMLLLADLNADSYVIQLDSDTLTLAPLPEVETQLARGAGFTLMGGGLPDCFETFAAAGARARAESTRDHPQDVVERALADFPNAAAAQYVRGNAAFVGYPPGCLSRPLVFEWLEILRATCGRARWDALWGGEEILSNILIANSPGSSVLPSARYAGYYPHDPAHLAHHAARIFLHFVGLHRFQGNAYARLARRQIARLGEPAPQSTCLVENA